MGYVLPRYGNEIFKKIGHGENFGHTDLSQDRLFVESVTTDKPPDKDLLIRRFTLLAIENCDLLTLSVKDLHKMKLEFPKIFTLLLHDARRTFRKELSLKIEKIKIHEFQLSRQRTANWVKSNIAVKLLGGI